MWSPEKYFESYLGNPWGNAGILNLAMGVEYSLPKLYETVAYGLTPNFTVPVLLMSGNIDLQTSYWQAAYDSQKNGWNMVTFPYMGHAVFSNSIHILFFFFFFFFFFFAFYY